MLPSTPDSFFDVLSALFDREDEELDVTLPVNFFDFFELLVTIVPSPAT